MAYTPIQIQQGMRAAKAAGDEGAYMQLRQMLTQAYQAEAPKATEGMSGGQKFLAGIGQGMTNIGRQAANIAGGAFGQTDEALAEAKQRDQALLDTGAGRAGSIVGEIAATAPLGGLAAGAARKVGAKALAAGLTEGAAQGGLTAGPGRRLGGAVEGAAFGAVLPAGGAALRRLTAPLKSTESARKLLRAGVNLTPGELNPTGKLNQWEQALQSSPFGGSTIRKARDDSMTDFQRAASNRAAAPGAGPLARNVDDVNEMARQVEGGYTRGYDQALGGYDALQPRIVRTAGGDVPLHTYTGPSGPSGAMVDAAKANYRGQLIKPEARPEMQGLLEAEMSPINRLRTTGRELQDVRSNIRDMSRQSDVPGERAILRGGADQITAALESQLAPQDAALLKALDAKYPEFKILQDVVKRGGDQPGGWTPAQLSQSVRAATDLGEYARGGGRLRDLSKAGREVFEQRSMPTGERQVTTGFLNKAGLPIATAIGVVGTKVPGKALAGETVAQRLTRRRIEALRRKYKSDLQAGQSLATAGMIQANKDQE